MEAQINIIPGVLLSSFDPFPLRKKMCPFWRVTIQTKTPEKAFSCCGGIYDAVQGGSNFKFVNEILKCYHSNKALEHRLLAGCCLFSTARITKRN